MGIDLADLPAADARIAQQCSIELEGFVRPQPIGHGSAGAVAEAGIHAVDIETHVDEIAGCQVGKAACGGPLRPELPYLLRGHDRNAVIPDRGLLGGLHVARTHVDQIARKDGWTL